MVRRARAAQAAAGGAANIGAKRGESAAVKMTAAKIVHTALVWAEENMLAMIGGLDAKDPHRAEVLDQWKQLRAYRQRRFKEGHSDK